MNYSNAKSKLNIVNKKWKQLSITENACVIPKICRESEIKKKKKKKNLPRIIFLSLQIHSWQVFEWHRPHNFFISLHLPLFYVHIPFPFVLKINIRKFFDRIPREKKKKKRKTGINRLLIFPPGKDILFLFVKVNFPFKKFSLHFPLIFFFPFSFLQNFRKKNVHTLELTFKTTQSFQSKTS